MIKEAVILSSGDELMSGRVVDTNSSYIAEKLFALGLDIVAILKVGDTRERLLWALRRAVELADLIIGTGGLGPTADDLSTEVAAEFLGRGLKMDDRVAEALKKRFASRGLPWTENNLKQALFPEGAEILPNPVGSAPGFRASTEQKKYLIWLSGVPREMEAMMQESVLPWVAKQSPTAEQISSLSFKIYGLTESRLDDILKPVSLPPEARLSFRAHYPDLTLRLTVRGGKEREKIFSGLVDRIRELIGPYVYAEGEATLEEVVGRLLQDKNWTLALAESCTGGAVGQRVTRVAGSSAYFKTGVIAYSNESKMRLLGVKKDTLERHGAVSRETALEMAEGVRAESQANVGLSVTGIAGPSGGSEEKPVGTVWIGIADGRRSEARHFRFQGERERVIQGASQAALHFLRTALLSP